MDQVNPKPLKGNGAVKIGSHDVAHGDLTAVGRETRIQLRVALVPPYVGRICDEGALDPSWYKTNGILLDPAYTEVAITAWIKLQDQDKAGLSGNSGVTVPTTEADVKKKTAHG